MKVKEFTNWEKVVLKDRAVLRDDLKFMSWEQIKRLDELEVLIAEDTGRTLICENRD